MSQPATEQPPAPSPSLLWLAALAVIVAAGTWLRLQQHPFHQNLWAIDWLGYYESQARDLHDFHLLSYPLRFSSETLPRL